ncbi:antifungal protein [Rhexocercosporidium sp. MPI-PUGE-AT-0058]|nr:antifungal protein [Rhexocercosporidium sp. MPI-PUGE-AT-0058]
MQISKVTLFFIAAMGAVASPIEPSSDGIDARAELITYTGTCTRSDNTCKYKGQSGANTFIKCPTAANKKCTNDGRACSYDSASKVVTCD